MLLIALAMLASQDVTTDCTRLGNTTRCESRTAPKVDWEAYNRTMQPAPNQPVDHEAAKARRGAAYAQVGELIAKGDCEAANRLARFYGQPDIIKDTARACPLKP